MSAFFGMLHFSQHISGALSARDKILDELDKRDAGESWSLVRPGLTCLGKSRKKVNFYFDDKVAVQVDGTVDWLDDDDSYTFALRERPGETIGNLYLESKFKWVSKLQGSYSIVIVDRTLSKVHLIRDKIGTKPLYYAFTKKGWVWGSRVSALQHCLDRVRLDYGALSEVVHYRWLVGDKKLLGGVKQVLQSHCVTLDLDFNITLKRYWELSFQDSGGDLETWVNKLDRSFHDYFRRMAKRYESVGVLLSAGVDSSLLAAIAVRHFKKVVAVTPKWIHGDNPELKRAESFSTHLGIEHIFPDITDDDLKEKHLQILASTEEPCRYYHAMALSKALEAFPVDVEAVMYGEAADTLFGSRAVDRALQFKARRYFFTKIPCSFQRLADSLLPSRDAGRFSRIRAYLCTDYQTYCHNIHAIESQAKPTHIFPTIASKPSPNRSLLSATMSTYDDPMEYVQAHMVFTTVTSHFETIDKMASRLNFDLLHPFICNDLINAASRFPKKLQIIDGVTKPVLRELGARYYPREWIFEKKIGFKVPTLNWLKGPLKDEMAILDEPTTKSRAIIECNKLLRLPLENNYELYYTAMSLERVLRNFSIDPN